MLLIADAGSTKTHWVIADKQERIDFESPGINPRIQSKELISQILKDYLLPETEHRQIEKVFYYGAGCGNPGNCELMSLLIGQYVNTERIYIATDLCGAARAVFYNASGIIAILGTGSNSGVYNGREIIDTVPAIGYILGDEGSGAAIGRKFLADLFYGLCPQDYETLFYKQYLLSRDEIIHKVYREPAANVFLAGIARFVFENHQEDYFYNLIKNSFKDFFRYHIFCYKNFDGYKTGFAGSVAFFNKQIINQLASEYNLVVSDFIKNPIENLVKYHLNLTGLRE